MLRESGNVVRHDGEYAFVQFYRRKACGSCGGESSCNTLSMGGGHRPSEVRAKNPIQAPVGATVMLEISEARFLKASFLIYGVPLIAFFTAGALLRDLSIAFNLLEHAELIGALGGLAALAGSFVILRKYNQKLDHDSPYQPTITEMLTPPAPKSNKTIPIASESSLAK
ncbi:SoxR reducing system RseC family protein [Magnetococcales bacterium HHB-1]